MTSINKPTYYVGLGASAGGLEALQAFLSEMPTNTGAAFMIVQHLSPDFKSVMVDLLSKKTDIKVVQATDSTMVEANTVYLIPPAKNMMIGEGRLLLSDQLPDRATSFPIDVFFRSLAEDCQHRSIAVVLSGTGSDGSRGISAIKEAGGLVLVQDPNTAKFDGMPRNAIQTNSADYIADPVQLALKIEQFISHPLISTPESTLVNGHSLQILNKIYSLLEAEMDVDFSRYKENTTRRRIQRRMGINQMEDIEDYYQLLINEKEELQILSKEMLIGVTRFFRDDEAFEQLEKEVIPNLIQELDDKSTLRIWSAGCSTGEEPISLAILADEYIRRHNREIDVKIFASDVDPDAIAVASNGRFSLNIIEDLGQERFEKYFEVDGDECVLIPRIRKMIIFAVHNIITDPPFSNIHLATCRNVLIYFQGETQDRVLSMLHFSLKVGGVLFLGASESNAPIIEYLESISDRNKLYRKVANQPGVLGHSSSMLAKVEHKMPSVGKLLEGYERQNVNVYNKLSETILEDYMPPSVLVSADKEVVHFYGEIQEYTKNPGLGKPSKLVGDMLVESLMIPVSTAIQKVGTTREKVKYNKVPVVTNSLENRLCNISVSAYQNLVSGPLYFLVVIEEAKTYIEDQPSLEVVEINYEMDSVSAQRIKDLEFELSTTQEKLKITVEELETTNEELQSSNEELLASNEELQSTNEELQSVNEELYTINSEYQQKITEVSEINNDFDTLINSVQIGILFLDADLIVRRFSPAISRNINLMKSDIGRPIHHISHNLNLPSFFDVIVEVNRTGTPYQGEVSTKHGGWVQVQVYSTVLNNAHQNTGCVVSITDISDIRLLEGRVNQAYAQLRKNVAKQTDIAIAPIKVLIADDDDEDVYLMKKAFSQIKRLPIEIDTALEAKEISNKLKSGVYDICLLDLNLVGMNALDLLESLNVQESHTPIILTSGVLSEEHAHRAAELGVYEVIEKSDIDSRILEYLVRFILQMTNIEHVLTDDVC